MAKYPLIGQEMRISNMTISDILTKTENMSASEIAELINENYKFCIDNQEEVCSILLKDKRKSVLSLAEKLRKQRVKFDGEIQRVKKLYDFDASYGKLVCGVDEVGRGPLAGPIVGCAVVLKNYETVEDLILDINDSKKLTKTKREEIFDEIMKRCVSYGIFEHSNKDIDNLGIAFCNNNIFLKSIGKLSVKPDIVLSDGFYVKGCTQKNVKVIKGDTKSAAIACASIVAKVYRDRLMEKYSEIYPGYGFESNVGYGSKKHIENILENGPCEIHRMSFLRNILSGNDYSIDPEE